MTSLLADLITIKHGYAFKGEYFRDSGDQIVLTPGNFHEEGGFRLRPGKEKFYAGPIPSDYLLKQGDVIVAMTEQGEGLLGSTAIVPQSGQFLHNQRLGLIRPKEGVELDLRFIYYLFNTRLVRQQIRATASGTKVRHTSPSRIGEVKAPIPSIDIQRRIASILSAYDDLIENNTRRIAILEEMARRIYEEWFVHFRFPGHEQVKMVESELGLIPEGWKILTVADFGKVITGKTPSKSDPENFGNEVPFIKTPDMHGNIFCTSTGEGLSAKGAGSQKGKTLPPNSLCVSCIGTAGIVSITTTPSQTNQQINAVVLNDLRNREFLYFALVGLRETINLYGANGATMVNLNKSKFEGLKIVCSDRSRVDHYHTVASPMFEEIRILQLKNANLRATRDLLLPKLISGELNVSTLPEPEEEAIQA